MSVFIAIALSLVEAKEAEAIYLGINAIDYSAYPDCRPEYVSAYQQLATLSSKAGIEGKRQVRHHFELGYSNVIFARAVKAG